MLEGELRSKELAEYLLQHNAGTNIWICEDGSGIIPKILYDPTLDQLIGITLPFDNRTGCPQRYEFTARDQDEIKKYMQHNKSTLVYIIMAIPMKEGIPPFILQLFGTDNKFNATNVVMRWNYTTQDLKKYDF